MKTVEAFPSAQSVYASLLAFLVMEQKKSLTRRKFHLALSGGTTPLDFFSWWVTQDTIFSWDNTHFWWVDERCVPISDPRSNYAQAAARLPTLKSIPSDQVHRMQGEIDPVLAAQQYGEKLSQEVWLDEKGAPILDVVLLGVGPDGHIASLFPETELVTAYPWTAVTNSPDGLARLTLTFEVLCAARSLAFLVTGPSKRELLEAVWNQSSAVSHLPVSRLVRARPDARWFVSFNH